MFGKAVYSVLSLIFFLLFSMFAPAVHSAEKYRISFFGGIHHVFSYGSEEDYVWNENDFPVTPAHTPLCFGASAAVSLAGRFDVELEGRYIFSTQLILRDPSDGDTVEVATSGHNLVLFNIIYKIIEGEFLPYLTFGIGFDKIYQKTGSYTTSYGFPFDIESPSSQRTVDPAVGLGMGIYYFISKRIGLRLDLRYVKIFEENKSLASFNSIFGLSFKF